MDPAPAAWCYAEYESRTKNQVYKLKLQPFIAPSLRGILVLFDLTDVHSFQHASELLEGLGGLGGDRGPMSCVRRNIVLVGTKADLVDYRQVPPEQVTRNKRTYIQRAIQRSLTLWFPFDSEGACTSTGVR